ncbi:MAG: hypothetical protein MI866_12940 [Bacteroidales bacterium]|nr:hypothetical protein [Bacteroidales bacterium]
MTFLKQLERYEQLHQLIRLKATGSPDHLASKLQISKSMLYVLLNTLKVRGAQIKYSHSKSTYYYVKPFKIHFG